MAERPRLTVGAMTFDNEKILLLKSQKWRLLFITGLAIMMCFIFFTIATSANNVECFGTKCYNSISEVPYKLNEIVIETILHRDNSLSYSELIGLSYNLDSLPCCNKNNAIIPEFALPKNSEISPNIKVQEVITDTNFKEVYHFDENCYGQFVFDRTDNLLRLCIEPKRQIKIKIETEILSADSYEEYE